MLSTTPMLGTAADGRSRKREVGLRLALHRQKLICELPAAVAFSLASMIAIASVPFWNIRCASQSSPPSPAPQIETRFESEGYDRNHHRLPFTVFVLSQEISWKFESSRELEGERAILNPELQGAINSARDVLCVGTASAEGHMKREEDRAARRAESLVAWVRPSIRNLHQTRLVALNVGQYNGPKDLGSIQQRKAIIIATGNYTSDVDFGEALRAGLERKQSQYPIVYSLLHHYSRSGSWLSNPKIDRIISPSPDRELAESRLK